MLKKFVPKLIILMVLLAITPFCFATANQKVIFSNSGNTAQIINNNSSGFEMQFRNQEYYLEEMDTPSGKFTRVRMEGFGYSQRIGEPQLPVYSSLISVPVGAKVEFSYDRNQEITLQSSETNITHRFYPAQPSISKSQDPALIPFEFKTDIYSKNEFYSEELFSVEEIGFLRGVRLFRLDYAPMGYNPVSGELKINTELNVQVKFVNADFSATQDLLARTAAYEFDSLYSKILLNWQKDERLNVNRYPTKIVILCPPNYTDEMQNFVNWKTIQGYKVILTTVGTGGTVANTTTAIKNYMQTLWNNATASDPAPTYLLIVGDTSTSGDNIIANTGSTDSSHITDLNYVRLNGTDYLPELYYGRFSVANATELTNVINKTITFEKTLMPDLTYLGKTVLIAGADANFGPTHGNGAINYATTQYFNSANNITSNTYLYPASASSDAQIIANASEGRGYINYTAHGSETSWYDPSFLVSDINNLTNTNKYSVVVGNCCLTNAFDTGVCFGEAFLRATNKGAVSYIGGTNSTYWDEDYWWAVGSKGTANGSAPAYDATKLGAYDAMFHTHSEAFTNWATTVGEAVMMGNSAVVQAGSSRINYYWEIYSIMGDPSLMPYYGTPTTNTATFPASILINATSINVTAEPYSRVALSKDGVLYGSDLVPASGTLTLTINPITTAGTATLVITAQNKITRIENITVTAGDTPYISVDNVTYSDSNNNIPEYNDTGYYSVTFKNLAQVASSSATATLTCSTAGITITDGTETLAAIPAGGTLVKNNAFRFTVANNIPDQLQANFKITITSGTYSWEYNFTKTFAAPTLAFGNITISDPTGNNNGNLDPGETATLSIPLNNSGGANSPAGSATLTCTTTGITINNGSAGFNAIAAGSSANLTFSISAASSMSQGTLAALNFNATAGAYTVTKTQNLEIGTPTVVTIGTGTSSTGTSEASPINVYYQSLHGQSVYTKAELNATGVVGSVYISQLGFNITGLPDKILPNFVVRMKHTTAADVSSWIDNTNLVTVYTNASYTVTQTGYNMLTLSTPFLWNGTDNIVIDTAFGLIGSYSQTGTVQYTAVANGYRYTRNDTADQTNVFSGGSTSSSKPNVKLFITAPSGNPQISVNPTSFSFGSVAVGTTSTQNFTIINTGGSTLTGSISTPTGYSVAALSKEIRNTLSFSIPAGQNKTYILSFSPVSAISYNGNVTISSNSQTQANLSLPVTGSGYLPATISVSANALSATLATGTESTQNFTISNTGSQSLTYSIAVSEAGSRDKVISPVKTTGSKSIEGSTLTLDTTEYAPGTTINWTFTVTNASTDAEWLKEVIVTFPAGVTVNSATNFVGGSGGDLVPDLTTGTGITISWFGENTNGYGLIEGSESATATVNVTISAGLTTPIILSYTINGDIWGAEPHTLSGEISLACSAPPVEWFTVTPISGTITAGGNQAINGHFSAVGMAEGVYNAVLTIQSNDPVHPVTTIPVTMDVSSGNHSPQINLPESFSFDKNGSLTENFAAYISDADNDPLTLSVSGNNHLQISIIGTQVTFTADQNWVGSENITFGVSDGELIAYDNTSVIVNPVNMPDWQPVVYPTNPATVYAQVSIEGIPAQLNDLVGAFVNNECRGTGEIVLIDRVTAYSTILVNLAANGELVTFKIYSSISDTVYPVQETLTMQTGNVYGSAENPVVLNGTTNIVLTPPQVNLVSYQNSYRLTWNAVPNANNYRIYSCSEPYGTYQLVESTAGLFWEIPTTQQKCFFRVIAEQIDISKGK